MNTKLFISFLLKRFNYAAAVTLLLLLTTSSVADERMYDCCKAKERSALYKKEDDPRMFLIAVIDSHDETIGTRCETDLDNVTDAFKDYADWLGADMVEPKIIEGDEFGKAAVNDAIDNWLKNQQPSENDIVVFYYSGHGFRYPNDASDYPRMWLKNGNNQDVKTNNLRMKEDVYDRIIKMGAGMNLVLSDCCNSTAAEDNANFDNIMVPTRKHEAHKREHPKNENSSDGMDNGDKLFIPDHPLSILATAAGKGELAGGTADVGGFFTNYFLDALDACIYDEKLEPSWETIFRYADEKASYWARSAACPEARHNEQGRCVQTAEIKIDVN